MSNKNKHLEKALKSNIELYTAMLERRQVSVYIGPELIGVGQIEAIDQECVRIAGEWYTLALCKFVVNRSSRR